MKIFDWSNRLFKTKKLFQRSHDLEKVGRQKDALRACRLHPSLTERGKLRTGFKINDCIDRNSSFARGGRKSAAGTL
jgi:hypothetical protein